MNDPTCPRCGLPPKAKSINRPSPYTAYLNVPAEQTPAIRAEIKSFTLALEAELLDCDADITRVEELLHLLKKEREAGQSFIAQHKHLLNRVHALPPEILLVVFRFCSDGNFAPTNRQMFTLGGEIPMPWVLSAVCRRWWNIFRDSPSAWASFEVDTASQTQTLFLQDALRLSQRAPLHFAIFLEGVSDARIQALVEHADRWESVYIIGSQERLISLGNLDQTPLLKTLWILLDSRNSGAGVDLTSVLARFGTCPQLDELSIATSKNIRVNSQMLGMSIPWENLTKLLLSFGPRSTDAICSMLAVCSNLHQLDIHGFRSDFGNTHPPLLLLPPSPPLSHPRITSLTLDNPPAFIHHTTYPALTHICIRSTDPQALLPFLSRHPRITHFELVLECDTPPEGWDPALQLFPDIVHFTLRVSPLSRSLPLWTSLSKSISARLPNLRTLTIKADCHLLKLCDNPDIIPLVVALKGLQRLEIYTVRDSGTDWRDSVDGVRALLKVATFDLPRVVSRMIEESTMVKALRGFQEGGLGVSINGIPLTDRSATLYM